MKLGLLRPPHLVDVKRLAGFGDIADGPRLTIGATVTHRALERSPVVRARCPLVASVARHVANVRVRNVGTVGGNLAFADPHSDLATLFLTLDASVELVSPRGRRAECVRARGRRIPVGWRPRGGGLSGHARGARDRPAHPRTA